MFSLKSLSISIIFLLKQLSFSILFLIVLLTDYSFSYSFLLLYMFHHFLLDNRYSEYNDFESLEFFPLRNVELCFDRHLSNLQVSLILCILFKRCVGACLHSVSALILLVRFSSRLSTECSMCAFRSLHSFI